MYTKGKWRVGKVLQDSKKFSYLRARGEYQIIVDDGVLAVMGVDWASGDAKANAQLISAAPDTAEALQELVSFLIHDGLGTNVNLVPVINRGTKALKKAGLPI